jgi:putative hydrolase of the HAD superfamily
MASEEKEGRLKGIKAVFFDLGGTLVDFDPSPNWGRTAERLARAAHERLGAQAPPLEQFLPTFLNAVRGPEVRQLELQGVAIPWAERLRRGLAAFGFPLPAHLPAALTHMISEELTPTARVEADVLPALAALHRAGLRLGIISNTPWDTRGHYLEEMLRREGLLDYLPVRLFSGNAGVRKPSPEIFAAALEACGVAPKAAAFVGDDLHADIMGALNAGWRAFWRRPPEVKEHAPPGCRTITSIREILPSLLP